MTTFLNTSIAFPLPSSVTGILDAFGPSLAGVILTATTEGWAGLRLLCRRLWLWRVGFRWYLFVLFWPALLSLSVTGLGILMGQPAPDFANPPDEAWRQRILATKGGGWGGTLS